MNDGQTIGTPWQSLARSTGKLVPGDSVLLKRGSSWREQLNITNSGSPVAVITYDAYGSGPRPIITGSNILNSWVAVGNGAYQSAPLPSAPTNLYVDGGNPLINAGSAQGVAASPGSWFYDPSSHSVYILTASRDNPASHLIEAAVRNYAVYASSINYIQVSNLEVKQTVLSGILAENAGSEYWTVVV